MRYRIGIPCLLEMEKSTRASARRKMHQTTVRFGEDLWLALETEADHLGISAAQYVRDAALSRLSYEAGQRDQAEQGGARRGEGAAAAQEQAQGEVSQSAAVWAQSRLARDRAAEVRSMAEATRSNLALKQT
jgi:hypothetical protein